MTAKIKLFKWSSHYQSHILFILFPIVAIRKLDEIFSLVKLECALYSLYSVIGCFMKGYT
jgi:hypothetical protein